MSTAAPRIATIDGLRGLAVMGILLMNVVDFALPGGAYFNPLAAGGTAPADIATWAIGFVLVDGKMRALFSILFGASTAIVIDRAYAGGRSGAFVHAARMATLALFGAAHFLFVWRGDILLHYAVIGLLAAPFVTMSPRQQIRVAVMLLLLQMVIGGFFLISFAELRAAVHAGGDAASVEAWRAFSAGIGHATPAETAQEVAVHRGPWTGMVASNLQALEIGPPFLLLFDGPETLAFMLIGMAGLGSGFLTGGWSRARYLRTAAIGYAIGLPPTIALCWLCFHSGFETLTTFAAGTLGGIPFRPVLALADAALALAWLGGPAGALRRRIEAAGRCAFTNYLGTSIVMTGLFDGWGLGLFGRIERIWLYPVVLLAWVAMLAWSAPWLARFRYGSFEWAWRSLARGKLQNMRRIDIESVSQ